MAQHKLDSLFPVNSSRRRWLKSAAALTVAAAGGILWREELSAFASDAEFFLKGPPVPDIKPEQLSRHVWMIYAKDGFPTPENRGMMSNITFAVTQKGVVILDGGGSVQIGEMAIRMIRTVTDKPVVALFASHYHGDHYLAAQAYFEAFGEIPFYAHPVTKEAIEKKEGNLWLNLLERWTSGATAGTKLVPPNRVANHGETFSFGDVTIRCHHYGVAHTPGDLCFEVVEDQVTYVGDVAMDRRIANMDDGSYPGSLHFIDQLTKNGRDHLWVPGHGRPSKTVLTWQRELFAGIWENALKAFEEGLDPSQAKALVLKDPRVAGKAKETAGWENNIGKYISLAVLEAEKLALSGKL
jgi:glyoxylase-like metal-dependent hydrolase (beta-lactamase superfamily II)